MIRYISQKNKYTNIVKNGLWVEEAIDAMINYGLGDNNYVQDLRYEKGRHKN